MVGIPSWATQPQKSSKNVRARTRKKTKNLRKKTKKPRKNAQECARIFWNFGGLKIVVIYICLVVILYIVSQNQL